MPRLFDSLTINRLELRNRFVRSATMESLGDQGMVTDDLLSLYRELATGEIGLIVTGGLFVRKDGQIAPGQLGADTDDAITGLSRLVKTVHESGGMIAAQLLHSGWNSRREVTGFQPVAPSPAVNPQSGVEAREISGDEVHELIELFGEAARRAAEARFDAIQIHGAHSHLIGEFLSPAINRREDEWGGSPEKRSSFVRRIYSRMRKAVGSDYPILIKLGVVDYHAEGKSLSEGIDTARALEADGIDAIEVSEGFELEPAHHIRRDATSPYYLEEGRRARQALSLPLVLVGGMRALGDMQAVLDEGIADAISMCRPFIMDPHIARNLREGQSDTSECNSCNGCLRLGQKGGIRCVLV
jgi:2,4-dienoyl-CoA reductase-like NADH-dependent reductase (Old Yellow Enzyme family)